MFSNRREYRQKNACRSTHLGCHVGEEPPCTNILVGAMTWTWSSWDLHRVFQSERKREEERGRGGERVRERDRRRRGRDREGGVGGERKLEAPVERKPCACRKPRAGSSKQKAARRKLCAGSRALEAANRDRKPRAAARRMSISFDWIILIQESVRGRGREGEMEGREGEWDLSLRCGHCARKSKVVFPLVDVNLTMAKVRSRNRCLQAICSHHISFVELVCNHIRLQMQWSKVVCFGEQIWQAILVCYSCTTSS